MREIPKEILDGLKRESFSVKPRGGQSVGVVGGGITLTHEELGFSISVEAHRSQFKNLDFAMIIFELYLQEMGY